MVSGKSCYKLAVHITSSLWYIHSMTGCLLESSMMVSHLMPSMSQMKSNKDVCLPWHCSAYCLQLCYWMHFQTMRTPSNYAPTLMGICLILRRLQTWTKMKITSAHDLLFTCNCALNVSSEAGLQQSMNKLSSVCNAFGLTISTQKVQVMCHPAPHTMWSNPRITVKGNALEVMDKFTYLRSVLHKNVTIDYEVNNRLAKASTTFSRLSKNAWECEGLSAHTKHKVYKAVVPSTFLYSCKTWTMYSRHVKKLNWFHPNCLRRLLHNCWWHRVPDTEVLNCAELLSTHTYLCKAQLHWGGHVLRMDDVHLPKHLPFG